MKSKYSDTYFAFQYAVNIKITQSGFRLWFWPLTPGAFMSDKLRQLARGVIYGESEKVWKLSTTDTTHWHVSARLYIAQHWVQCSHSCSLHSSLQHLYFQARLLSHGGRLHCLVRHQGPQQSLSPCLLPSHPSQPSDWSCQGSLRPRSCSQASFLPILQQTQAHKSRGRSQSCLRVRLCQVWRNRGPAAKLRELTGGVYDFEELDESDSDDQLSDC